MYTQIAANKRKTVFLILGFIVLLTGLGWVASQLWGNPTWFIWIAVFAVVYALITYYASDKIALALAGAKPVTKKEAPQLYRIVENLAITAGLPTPRVYIIHDQAPNAFATGRDPKHAVVAVTTGLLEMLEDEELEGVIAHELSHVGNYDIRLMAVVLVLVTLIVYISDFFMRSLFWGFGGDDNRDRGGNGVMAVVGLALIILAPVVATLLQLAVSRRREFLADASGVMLTRYPDGLARALTKIGSYPRPMRKASNATAHLFFANPLKGSVRGRFISLFSTHPPIEERVRRLQAIAKEL